MDQEVTIELRPTHKQHEAYNALKTKSEVFFGGGAGGGKSWWLCESRLVMCYLFPGYKSFIARSELKRLMQSTFLTWCKVCKHHGIPDSDWRLNGQYNFIEFKNGSRIDLLDVKYLPSDPLYERFGSLEFTDGAIEECGEVHEMAYEVLKTRIGRHMNQEHHIKASLAMTGNPKKNWTYNFFKDHRDQTLSDRVAFIQALYHDNPHTASSYKEQLSQIRDKATRQRLMLGDWDYESSPNALCMFSDINDSFFNDHVEEGKLAMSCDIALMGSDKLVIGIWSGLRLKEVIVKDKAEAKDVVELIKTKATEYRVPRSRIVFDADGLGSYLTSYLQGAVAFNANAKAMGMHRDEFASLKDQCGYKLAELINEGALFIEDHRHKETISDDLSQLETYKIDDDKKLKIIPKALIKERIGRSPDFLDMMLMRMRLEVAPITAVKMRFASI